MPHTEGPWESRPVPTMRLIAIARKGMMYPHAYVQTATKSPEPIGSEQYDTAALIESAPDLLRELKALKDYVSFALTELNSQQTGWYYQLQQHAQLADRVITKAERRA